MIQIMIECVGECKLLKNEQGKFCMPRDFVNDLQKNVDRITELNNLATSIENISGEKEFYQMKLKIYHKKCYLKR